MKKTTRILAFLLAAVMCLFVFAACGKKKNTDAPGCSFVPMTPGTNIKAMTDAVKASKKSFAKGKN